MVKSVSDFYSLALQEVLEPAAEKPDPPSPYLPSQNHKTNLCLRGWPAYLSHHRKGFRIGIQGYVIVLAAIHYKLE